MKMYYYTVGEIWTLYCYAVFCMYWKCCLIFEYNCTIAIWLDSCNKEPCCCHQTQAFFWSTRLLMSGLLASTDDSSWDVLKLSCTWTSCEASSRGRTFYKLREWHFIAEALRREEVAHIPFCAAVSSCKIKEKKEHSDCPPPHPQAWLKDQKV